MVRWSEQEIEKLEKLYPYKKIEELEKEFQRDRQAIRKKASRLNLKKEEAHQAKKKLSEIETPRFEDEEFNWFISGFVAGEGNFSKSKNKNRPRPRFKFSIIMSEVDTQILKKIKSYFNNAGNYYEYERENENWKTSANYQVDNIPELAKIIIPFFSEYGFKQAHKQKQFDEWKKQLIQEYNIPKEQIYKS